VTQARNGGVVVGVADMAVARAGAGRIVTYALGSCIGLTAYDPVARVGGLLHFMLPQPGGKGELKQLKPYMYATTGIPMMLRKLVEEGAVPSRLVLCAAGGAEILANASTMAIGKRNRTMLRRILWKMNLPLEAEDTGGSLARTMMIDLEVGTVEIRVQNKTTALWEGGSPALKGK